MFLVIFIAEFSSTKAEYHKILRHPTVDKQIVKSWDKLSFGEVSRSAKYNDCRSSCVFSCFHIKSNPNCLIFPLCVKNTLLVDAFIAMGTKVITLCLNNVRRQVFTSVCVKI